MKCDTNEPDINWKPQTKCQTIVQSLICTAKFKPVAL